MRSAKLVVLGLVVLVVLGLFGTVVVGCTEDMTLGDGGADAVIGADAVVGVDARVVRDSGPSDALLSDAGLSGDAGDSGPVDIDASVIADGGLDLDAGPLSPDGGLPPALSCADICHGDRDNPAPPLSVFGETATTVRGVGAHRSHLGPSPWHREVQCQDCHIVPTTLRSPGHLDSTPQAELTWGAIPTTGGAMPSFDGTTCSGAYCHGATLLPGGTNTTPRWTMVDGTQAACGTCHGLPPGGAHPPGMDCSTCHPTVDAARNIVDPARHIDGHVDLSTLSCTTCHGTDGAGPAPPRDTSGATATTVRGVGAHASHVRPSTWHRDVACSDCHTVPSAVSDVGHNDTPRPAELTWGAIATTRGSMPSFDGTTCSGAYCHGATLLPGGTNTTPRWTTVDGTQAACGTCHGLPPGGGHPTSGACSTCHPTVDAARNIIDPARHIDGTVDTIGLSCTTCHGDAALGPAPPRDTTGGTATSARGVGAHQSHLRTSTWHRDIACTECHVLPATVGDVGHNDTALPAELTFGPLAVADGATPSFDGTRCNGAYCHGTTLLPGGTLTTPTWTTVDGTQAACGTCHGLPPGGSHPSSSACSTCHPTVDAARNIIDRTRHIDGTVDVVALTCTSCHGDALTNAAPPVDTTGGSATTLRGVGAHQSHLRSSTWRRGIACTECHTVPAAITDVGHIDSTLPAELSFGPLARADGAAPSFDGTRCDGAYCHGATLPTSGTLRTPTWTTVDGTQAACGTCHGLPPGAGHPTEANCSMCHSSVIDATRTIIAPSLHVNGTVERTSYHPAGWAAATSHGRDFNARGPGACTSCHGATLTGGSVGVSCESCHSGWQTNCTFCHGSRPLGYPEPPDGVDGESARLSIAVGAHREHVRATATHIAWDCTMCHGPSTPTSALSSGHIDGDGVAEEAFGPIRGTGTTYTFTTGVCGNTYCHGNGNTRAAAPAWSTDPTLTCGSCHAPFSGATSTQLRAMSGRHDKHVRGEGFACSTCHSTTISSTGALLRVDLHVNGIAEVSVPSYTATRAGCPDGGCNPGGSCHGGECW